MRKNKKDFAGQRNKGVVEQVTLPLSDTVPGPGNYTVGILNLHGQGLPVVDSTELISTMGAGTAKDMTSAFQVPVPGLDDGNAAAKKEKGQNEQP